MPKVSMKCEYCGQEKLVWPCDVKKFRFCSKKCNGHHMRDKTTKPVGHSHISHYGYRLVKYPDHPNADHNGYVFEHRKVMSDFLGRPLAYEEEVHHKDGNKLNNDITNLELTTRKEHFEIHQEELKQQWLNAKPWELRERDSLGRWK